MASFKPAQLHSEHEPTIIMPILTTELSLGDNSVVRMAPLSYHPVASFDIPTYGDINTYIRMYVRMYVHTYDVMCAYIHTYIHNYKIMQFCV